MYTYAIPGSGSTAATFAMSRERHHRHLHPPRTIRSTAGLRLHESISEPRVSTMSTLQTVVAEILDARSSIPSQRSVLTAITGIDSCGKGYESAGQLPLLMPYHSWLLPLS